MRGFFLTVFLCLISFVANAVAQKSSLQKNIIGKAGGWNVLYAKPHGQNVCYAILYPSKHKGNKKNTIEKPYIMVHYFSPTKLRFTVYAGFPLHRQRGGYMSVAEGRYELKPLGSYAMAHSFDQEMQILKNMQNAHEMLIRLEGGNYEYSIDTYTIAGYNDALQIMQKHCVSSNGNSSFKGIVPTKNHLKTLNSAENAEKKDTTPNTIIYQRKMNPQERVIPDPATPGTKPSVSGNASPPSLPSL